MGFVSINNRWTYVKILEDEIAGEKTILALTEDGYPMSISFSIHGSINGTASLEIAQDDGGNYSLPIGPGTVSKDWGEDFYGTSVNIVYSSETATKGGLEVGHCINY